MTVQGSSSTAQPNPRRPPLGEVRLDLVLRQEPFSPARLFEPALDLVDDYEPRDDVFERGVVGQRVEGAACALLRGKEAGAMRSAPRTASMSAGFEGSSAATGTEVSTVIVMPH